MYKRDFAVLVLSAFAVYFALQNDGNFSFRKAWYANIQEEPLKGVEFLHNRASLPNPIVIDLNGDGDLEVVVATHDFKIQVLKPRGVGKDGDGFAPAKLMAEVLLLPEKMTLTAGRHPVAMSAGYIDPPPVELVRKPRKAVLVVVTADWHVTCFNHNLEIMWRNYIHESLPHHAVIKEIAVSISNHTIYNEDRGLIIIGGSLHLGATLDEEESLGASKGLQDEDPFEAEIREEKNEEQQALKMDAKEKLADIGISDFLQNGADVSRHFSYYAYEGGEGHSRWTHEGTDFHRDLDTMRNTLIPQVNYRLDAEGLESKHFGEVSCREYRESILHNLPHQWSSRGDTKLVLSHFVKHKPGKGSEKKSLGDKGGKSSGQGSKSQRSEQVSALLTHGVGKVTKDGKKPQQLIKDPIAELPPNSIVAHLKEGMEAIHLYSGRPLCKLHLPEGGLHADLNGDGVLDHVQTTGGSKDISPHGDTSHHTFPSCYAYATSGIPPSEPLFNGSICRGGQSDRFIMARLNEEGAHRNIEVAPPIMLPVPTPSGQYRFRYGQRGYAVFLTNRGLITAFGAHGAKKWQISTDCRWRPKRHLHENFVPTLKPLAVRTHSLPTMILAAGLRHGELISEHGHRLHSLDLPEPPREPLQIIDFNGDGLNDIILIGEKSIWGYAQVQHPGGVSFSVLLLGLIIAMGVVYMTQAGAPSRRPGQPMKRSTDRVD